MPLAMFYNFLKKNHRPNDAYNDGHHPLFDWQWTALAILAISSFGSHQMGPILILRCFASNLLHAVALSTRREAHPLLLGDVPPMTENSWCHNQSGQISSAPSSSMEAIDKGSNAEESEKDCSPHYKARENTKTRKLLLIFKFGGESKHVVCNPHLKYIRAKMMHFASIFTSLEFDGGGRSFVGLLLLFVSRSDAASRAWELKKKSVLVNLWEEAAFQSDVFHTAKSRSTEWTNLNAI